MGPWAVLSLALAARSLTADGKVPEPLMSDNTPTASYLLPAGAGNEECPGPPRDPDVAALGQSVMLRLFSAGLDMNVALGLVGGGAGEAHLRRAVGDLDEAVRDLRHLLLALPETGTRP